MMPMRQHQVRDVRAGDQHATGDDAGGMDHDVGIDVDRHAKQQQSDARDHQEQRMRAPVAAIGDEEACAGQRGRASHENPFEGVPRQELQPDQRQQCQHERKQRTMHRTQQ